MSPTATVYCHAASFFARYEQKISQLQAFMQEYGYELIFVTGALQSGMPWEKDRTRPIVHLLFGDPAEQLGTILRLRASLHSADGIITALTSFHDSVAVQMLQCGADACLALENSHALYLATLHSVVRRQRIYASEMAYAESEQWLLADEGWSVVSPDGEHIGLTTVERHFFEAIAEQEGLRISHEDLLEVLRLQTGRDLEAKVNRLGVIVSRLRKKFDRKGLELPLKSIHNWGYMFAAPLKRR